MKVSRLVKYITGTFRYILYRISTRNREWDCHCEGGTRDRQQPKLLHVAMIRCDNCGGFMSIEKFEFPR